MFYCKGTVLSKIRDKSSSYTAMNNNKTVLTALKPRHDHNLILLRVYELKSQMLCFKFE